MTPFFHLVNTRAICRLGIISFAHASVHVTDCPVVNVHVDELSSARIIIHNIRGHRGRDRMVVSFTTTHTISTYHH